METTSMTRALAALSFIGLALAGCTADPPPAPVQPLFYQDLASPSAAVSEQEALNLINGYRANNGVPPLALDPRLSAIAQAYADRMAAADDHGHNLDGRSDLGTRLTAGGYAFDVAGENIAAGYRTLAEAFSGWRDSPDHDRGMRDPEPTHMGIATAYNPDSRYKVFWCLIFAKPKAVEPVVLVVPASAETTLTLAPGQ